jgi:hypothetical protein
MMTQEQLKVLIERLQDSKPSRQYRPLYDAVLYLLYKDMGLDPSAPPEEPVL